MGWGNDLVVEAPAWGAGDAVVNADMPGVRAAIKEALPKRKGYDFADGLAAGLQSSIVGLIARGKAPETVMDEDPTVGGRIASNLVQTIVDLPVMAGGFILGAGAGAPSGPGAAVTGMAGAFGLPAGLRATLMDAYENGEFKDFGDFWSRASHIIWETVKGEATGAATALSGGAAKALPLTTAFEKVAIPTAAEIATMTTVGSVLEGHAPSAQDFLDGAMVIGGIKVGVKVAGKMRSIYKETGRTPGQVVADARENPELAAELKTGDSKEIPGIYKEEAAQQNARSAVPEPGVEAREAAKSPFADIPQAKGEPTQPTHVNYNYLNTTEDAAAALSRLSSIYEAKIQEQRRGTVSWEETSAEAGQMLADALGVDPKLIAPREPGTAAGAAEILARKQMVIGAAEDMAREAREYVEMGSEASPEDTARFLASIERAAMIQSGFLGARAEAGRALNILKSTARDAERTKLIQQVIDQYGKDPAKLAKMLGEIDTPEGAAKFAREAVKATTWEKIVEAWKAGLLSGPVTHAANILGNTTFLVLRAPIDMVASGIGLLHGGEKVAVGEGVARMIGALQGTMDGLKVAGAVLKTGDVASEKGEQFRKAIEGTKGEVIRAPFRLLSAEDAVFRTMNERGEAYTLAARQASAEGLNPATREYRERVASIVANPTEAMQEAVKAAGGRFTFNTELGEFGQSVQNLVRKGHLEWIMPFVRTPTNIAKELVRMTPFAPLPLVRVMTGWKADFDKGGAARDKAIAEVVVGSSIMTAVVAHAFAGNLSGSGDPDPGKRRVQMAAGWQPYSIKIDGKWYSYQRLQPVGTLMGIAADMANVWDHMTEEESDKLPKIIAVAFANAITNQTFLQGVTQIVQALSEPQRFAPKFLQGMAGSLVPAIVNQAGQMTDPIQREVNSMLDAIKSRIPVERETLLPKRDVFGEPVAQKERMAAVLPITETTVTNDPVRAEAARLSVSLAAPPKKLHVGRGSGNLGEVKLTPEQQDIFEQAAGKFAHEQLADLISTPQWTDLSDLERKRVFTKVFEQAHKVGSMEAIPEGLRLQIIDAVIQKQEALLAKPGGK